jgi:hypothetical protein
MLKGAKPMSSVFEGVIHGRSIELTEDSGLPDGQTVRVIVESMSAIAPTGGDAREALQRAAGSWSDDVDGLDQYLEWNRQQRKGSRREISG